MHTFATIVDGPNSTVPVGVSVSKVASAATTNAASVKASPGRLMGWSLTNTTAAFKFFRVFNKASAPTVGTDSPALVIGLPPNSTTTGGFADSGIALGTGIAYAITGLAADLDATATAANDVVGALLYS